MNHLLSPERATLIDICLDSLNSQSSCVLEPQCAGGVRMLRLDTRAEAPRYAQQTTPNPPLHIPTGTRVFTLQPLVGGLDIGEAACRGIIVQFPVKVSRDIAQQCTRCQHTAIAKM